VIDVNYYPVEEARRSNMRHRPIGLGIQGFADALALLRFPYESKEAAQLNRDVFEAMYFGAVTASVELAEALGAYPSFAGSPASQGKLQFDLWGVEPSAKYDWAGLKARVIAHGLRNSLLLAPMPTASTAQILGNNESFEPFTTNLYNRRVLAGEFCCVNKHLLRDLIERDLWSPTVRMQLLAHKGSVQGIPSIPDDVKELYKTVWEIKQRTMIDMAAARGPFICQSQSLNLFIAEATVGKLTSAHFHAWSSGLKTGMYYLRTRPRADAIPFTVDQVAVKEAAAHTAAIASGFVDPAPGRGGKLPAALLLDTASASAAAAASSGPDSGSSRASSSGALSASSTEDDGPATIGFPGARAGAGAASSRYELSLDGSPLTMAPKALVAAPRAAAILAAPVAAGASPADDPVAAGTGVSVTPLTPFSMAAAIAGEGFSPVPPSGAAAAFSPVGNPSITPKKLALDAVADASPATISAAEQARRMAAKAERDRIRAEIAAGTYEAGSAVCTNCSS